MPHYKDPQNKVHFIEDAQFEYLLPAGSVPITDIEAAELREQDAQQIVQAEQVSPVDKLKQFLSSNPDVAELLK